MCLHGDYWENKITYQPQSHPHPLDTTHDTHRQSNDSWSIQKHTQHTVCQLSSYTYICIQASAFTSSRSRVRDQCQHNCESQQGDWVTPSTWWGWEREVGYTSGQLWGRSRLRMEWVHELTTANSHFEVVYTVQQGLSVISSPTFHRAL